MVGKRTLRAEEDYLRDHFPKFPVMPGVMMLEALYQAAMWMVRTGDDFQYPLVFLREARAVKFADFLSPGETLVIEVEAIKTDGSLVTVKAQGRKGERPSVQARLVIERRDLAPHQRGASSFDIRQRVKKTICELLWGSVGHFWYDGDLSDIPVQLMVLSFCE